MTNPERKRRIDKLMEWIEEEIKLTQHSAMGFKTPTDLSPQFDMGKHVGFFSTRETIADLIGYPKKQYVCLHNGSCRVGPCAVSSAFKPIHCIECPHLIGYCLWQEYKKEEE